MGTAADWTRGHLTRLRCLPEPGPQVISDAYGRGLLSPPARTQGLAPTPHLPGYSPASPPVSPCPSWQRSGPPSSQGCSPPLGAPRCSPAGDRQGGGWAPGFGFLAKNLSPRSALVPDEDCLSLPTPHNLCPSALEHPLTPAPQSPQAPPASQDGNVQ